MSISSLWTTAGQPHPGSLALATDDLDHAREHLSRVFVDHRLVADGSTRALNFRHYHAALRDVSFNGVEYGSWVTVEAPALTDFYMLQFTLRGACEIACGTRSTLLRPGSILVMNPTRPYRKRWSANSRQLIVRIEKALLVRELADLLGRMPERPLEFDLRPVEAKGGGATLARFAELICRDLYTEGRLTHPRLQASVRDTLGQLILASLPHSYSETLERPAELPAPGFIRRAEDFIHAHIGAEVTVADVAKAAGVSLRTLHRGFRSFRDTTPLAHLKAVRLTAARDALLAGDKSVTEVAAACGLSHLGKFARDYRRRFGERPSDTVRRSP